MNRTLVLTILAVFGIAVLLLLPRMEVPIAPVTQHVTPAAPAPAATPTPGAGSLTLRARPTRSAFLAAGDDVDLVWELEAVSVPGERRAPVDIALVIDKSGSMGGDPIRKAREAAQDLVGRLGPDDRLAIVAFSSSSSILMTATKMDESGRNDARAVISGISSDGGTNISSGLENARRALEMPGIREGVARRVILLSDGQANEGITGAGLSVLSRRLGGQGLRISALGLGNDFDEDTMAAIADASGGKYSYLRDSDAMAAAFAQELRQASATAATGIRLELVPGAGVEITDVLGYESTRAAGSVQFGVADMAAGETKRLVVRVHATSGADGLVSLVQGRVSYTDLLAGNVLHGAEAVASADATHDQGRVSRSWDAEAAKTGLRARYGAALMTATRSYEANDVAAAEGTLDRIAREVKAAATSFGDAAFADEMDKNADSARNTMHAAPSGAAKYTARKNLKEFGRDNLGL